jgi:hypothetical protein
VALLASRVGDDVRKLIEAAENKLDIETVLA